MFSNRDGVFEFLSSQINKPIGAPTEPLASLPIPIKNKIDFQPASPLHPNVGISLKDVAPPKEAQVTQFPLPTNIQDSASALEKPIEKEVKKSSPSLPIQLNLQSEVHCKMNYERSGTSPTMGILQLTVIEAKNLVGKDGCSLPDTFVHVQLGKLHKKTRVTKKASNPNYQETLDFEIKHYESPTLMLSVVEVTAVGTEKLLSVFRMDISQFFPVEQPAPQISNDALTLLKQFQLTDQIVHVKKQHRLTHRPWTNVQGDLSSLP